MDRPSNITVRHKWATDATATKVGTNHARPIDEPLAFFLLVLYEGACNFPGAACECQRPKLYNKDDMWAYAGDPLECTGGMDIAGLLTRSCSINFRSQPKR
jgi:hypothetical protein